jgi:hypothetical protein
MVSAGSLGSFRAQGHVALCRTPVVAVSELIDTPPEPGDATSFRSAFSRARDAARDVPDRPEPAAPLRPVAGVVVPPPAPVRPAVFEVRIERRRGKRARETARWNELGRKGWELVAVEGKHAFFRRARHVR